jgi:pimeloyl-ACP methyl ester carboxylesterase
MCKELGKPLQHLDEGLAARDRIDSLVVPLDGGVTPPEKTRELNPVIVYCHGNKRNICSCTHMIQHLAKVAPAGTLVLFDYENFGLSRDTRDIEPYSPRVLARNVRHVLEAVAKQFTGRDVFLYGHSFGAAIVANVLPGIRLTFPSVKGVILEGVPYRLSWVAPWPYLSWVTWAAMWTAGVDARYPVAARIKEALDLPMCFFNSKDDDVVPFDHQRLLRLALYEKDNDVPEWYTLSGPHAKANYDDAYIKQLRGFIAKSTGL